MKFLYAAILALILLPGSGHAQSPTGMVNCQALNGSPLICFKNESAFPIVGIQTSSSMAWGTDWTAPPGGPIPPGGTTVIRLPSGWSGMKYMSVKTADGGSHVINHGTMFDIYRVTSVTVGRNFQ